MTTQYVPDSPHNDKELYTFVNDLHIHAPNELKIKGYLFNPSNQKEYYLGDNLDMTNCKKMDVRTTQSHINILRTAYGNRFIAGNHEAQRDCDRLVIIKPGIGVMHGDLIFWGIEKSEKYRRKDHGAGFLKRFFWVNALEALEAGYDRKISKEDIDRFDEICKVHGVHTIIVGHLHPEKTITTISPQGNKLIALKRGVNDLWL